MTKSTSHTQPTQLELDSLFPAVYAELRRLAHRRLRAEVKGHTLSTTALVHETYLKLADQRNSQFDNRPHFFALAARAMRRILVDYARRHRALKRSLAQEPVSLAALERSDAIFAHPSAKEIAQRADLLMAVDEALAQLIEIDPRLARVEYRFFVGLTEQETAELLA
jgi:RNA polymerase sigma factor (TIGR02999 family)